MTAYRAVGGGRGGFKNDEFILQEKHGNDGHVVMYFNGVKTDEFETPYHLKIPRSEKGTYTFEIAKSGFRPLKLQMDMSMRAGTAVNGVMLPIPILAGIGVGTDGWLSHAGNSTSGKDVEEDGDKVYYVLTPIGGGPVATSPVIRNNAPQMSVRPEVIHHYHTNVLVQVPEPEIRTVYVTNPVPVYVDRVVPTTNNVIIIPPSVRPADGSGGGTATSGTIFVNPRRN